jgi:GT2 family glycosyltransferase
VVIDNGSSDGTVEALRRYPNVEIIANAENRWLSPAWEQGLRRCSSPYVALLNPDCEVKTADWIIS